jgi:hypothetical protein
MLVMQASDKSSPKQPLGQRREFIPCHRLAATAMSHNGPPDGLSTLKNERGLLEGAMAGRQAAGRGF